MIESYRNQKFFHYQWGEVQLEWEDDNAYLEITIGVVPRFKVYYSKPKKGYEVGSSCIVRQLLR